MDTQELKLTLSYDPTTGVFTWKQRPREHFKTQRGMRNFNNRFAGKVAGGSNGQGYHQIVISGKHYAGHRLAFMWMGLPIPNEVDHINRVKSDNRWSNLRSVSRTENNLNKGVQSNNTSGITGVRFNKTRNKWVASLQVNNKVVHNSYHDNFEDAVDARSKY